MSDQYIDRAGTYICIVEKPSSGWFAEAGERATPYIRLPLRVISQKDGSTDQVNRFIYHQAWLSEKAVDNTIKTLCQCFPSWGGDLDALASGQYGFDGKECEIVCELENYEGKTRVKVKWLNPVGGGGKPMDRAKVSGLIAKLGAKTKAIAKDVATGGVTPTTSRPAPDEDADDFIPF
jgi:hypothetical protein